MKTLWDKELDVQMVMDLNPCTDTSIISSFDLDGSGKRTLKSIFGDKKGSSRNKCWLFSKILPVYVVRYWIDLCLENTLGNMESHKNAPKIKRILSKTTYNDLLCIKYAWGIVFYSYIDLDEKQRQGFWDKALHFFEIAVEDNKNNATIK